MKTLFLKKNAQGNHFWKWLHRAFHFSASVAKRPFLKKKNHGKRNGLELVKGASPILSFDLR